jgi:hypothetical protein
MYRDRVFETSTSTGTGAFTLAGAAAGFRSFSAAFGSNPAYYVIANTDVPAEWEIGSFTVSGTTLTRTSANVLAGSAGVGTLVNFSAGNKNVYNSIPASRLAFFDAVSTSVSPSGELQRTLVYKENRINNCAGTVPNGNCLGNSTWDMPNANWWTWGLGLTHGNPFGYDGVGGTQTANYPVSQTNTPNYGAYSRTAQDSSGFDIYTRTWQNCNCGATNCIINCNCNCNCDCNCRC